MDNHDFNLSVQGHLVTNGIWRIEARLRFRDGLDPQPGDDLLDDGRLALIEAILREGQRGRALGASACRVLLDLNGDVRDVELGDFFKEEETTH